jgi:hypothetical protein
MSPERRTHQPLVLSWHASLTNRHIGIPKSTQAHPQKAPQLSEHTAAANIQAHTIVTPVPSQHTMSVVNGALPVTHGPTALHSAPSCCEYSHSLGVCQHTSIWEQKPGYWDPTCCYCCVS